MTSVLVVDDNPAFLTAAREVLEKADPLLDVHTVASGQAALDFLLRAAPFADVPRPSFVLLDYHLPDFDAPTVLERARRSGGLEGIPVFVLSQADWAEDERDALRAGAARFSIKPSRGRELRDLIVSFLAAPPASNANLRPASARTATTWCEEVPMLETGRPSAHALFSYERPIVWGASAAMRRVQEAVEQTAAVDATVLISGPTGAGKEVVARAVHDSSRRRGRPFIAINCGGLSEGLLEAELFGHQRGAFTGADRARKGLFVESRGGTLLLDEVGEASQRLQTRLLRVLEAKEVTPVGASIPVRVDVRVIAATNRDLAKLVEDGRIREDLYHRLSVLEIRVPSLSERREDISDLIDHFLVELARAHRRDVQAISSQARLGLIHGHDYPGNVRELRNILERAIVRARPSEVLTLAHLGLDDAGSAASAESLSLVEEKKLFERRRVEEALRRSGGSRVEAAKELRISVRWLHKILGR